MENLTGRQFGPYQITAPLGEGGMAAVYKAYQPAMERYVALKVLPRHFAEDPQFVTRFQREAILLAKLQHPHILPVFDYGQADGFTYIVMPFVPSGTLTDELSGRPQPLPRIRQVISQIGDALSYAHSRGLIHRDIKPSNVLVDESGNCLLTDFGLARMMEDSINLTTSGTIMGTPAYIAPEQGSGEKLDARCDIYSLGIILYEMATGRVPYQAGTPMEIVHKHIQDPLPPPRAINPNLPETIERIIIKALAKRPDNRYQSANDMVRAIQIAIPESPASSEKEIKATLKADAIQVGSPARQQTPEASIPRTIRKKIRSPFRVWAMIGAVALLAVIGGLFMIFKGGIVKDSPAVSTSISASASLIDSPATNAVDGDPETIWSSGQNPEQWIMLDLGDRKTVSAIRLNISQFPEGQTVHQIWAGTDITGLTLVHEFKGFTSDPGVLEFIPSTPLKNVRFIKIITTQSPSWVAWREIEVISE